MLPAAAYLAARMPHKVRCWPSGRVCGVAMKILEDVQSTRLCSCSYSEFCAERSAPAVSNAACLTLEHHAQHTNDWDIILTSWLVRPASRESGS